MPRQGYPESLHVATLWPVPLDDELAKIQEENVPSVEALPGHIHLGSTGQPGSHTGPIHQHQFRGTPPCMSALLSAPH